MEATAPLIGVYAGGNTPDCYVATLHPATDCFEAVAVSTDITISIR